MVELTAGLHYLEYYHEEVRWSRWPSSAGGRRPTPAFRRHSGVVLHRPARRRRDALTRTPKGPLLPSSRSIADSVWPAERSEGQYTRVRFAAGKGRRLPDGHEIPLGFRRRPDGRRRRGRARLPDAGDVPGDADGAGTGRDADGALAVDWFSRSSTSPTSTRRAGRRTTRSWRKGTTARKLSAAPCGSWQHLLAESEEPAECGGGGQGHSLQRFPNADALTQARVRRLMADSALRRARGPRRGDRQYQASLVKEMPAGREARRAGPAHPPGRHRAQAAGARRRRSSPRWRRRLQGGASSTRTSAIARPTGGR